MEVRLRALTQGRAGEVEQLVEFFSPMNELRARPPRLSPVSFVRRKAPTSLGSARTPFVIRFIQAQACEAAEHRRRAHRTEEGAFLDIPSAITARAFSRHLDAEPVRSVNATDPFAKDVKSFVRRWRREKLL